MGDFASELAADIAAAESEAALLVAYRTALEKFDALNAEVIREAGARLDCGKGCSFCCSSLRVDAFAHEVFVLAAHVRTHFSEAEQAALLERLHRHAEQVLVLTPFEHATQNIPCPLLRDGCCSVYEARPQACRRHHSLRVEACQYAFEHPTDLEYPSAHEPVLSATLTEAMRQSAEAYAQNGYDTTIYELGTALEEALTDPESWEGWRQRMEAFVRASVTPA